MSDLHHQGAVRVDHYPADQQVRVAQGWTSVQGVSRVLYLGYVMLTKQVSLREAQNVGMMLFNQSFNVISLVVKKTRSFIPMDDFDSILPFVSISISC